MGHGHTHESLSKELIEENTSPLAKQILLVFLAAVFAVTSFGIWQLWPSSQELAKVRQHAGIENAPGVSYEKAEIKNISQKCSDTPDPEQQADNLGTSYKCKHLEISLLSGPESGKTIEIDAPGPPAESGLKPGDLISVMRTPNEMGSAHYSINGIYRTWALAIFAFIFVLVTLVISRWKGLFALAGLAFSVLVLWYFMLPALLAGKSGLLVGLSAAIAIMYVVIYVAHGFSYRSSAALAGTIISLIFATGLGAIAASIGRLSGLSEESSLMLSASAPSVNFRNLLIASMIVASLGILNDVTITQASAVWELRAAGPQLSRFEVFKSAMRIGCDHIASSIYTIVFAYAGAALSSLLLLVLYYRRSLAELMTYEVFSAEALRTLASATGLILSVPITTAIAVAMVRKAVISKSLN